MDAGAQSTPVHTGTVGTHAHSVHSRNSWANRSGEHIVHEAAGGSVIDMKFFLGVATICGALILTSCSAGTQYSILYRDATPADTLPLSILESDAEIDHSTSRFVAVDDGVSLWLVAPEGTPGICLVLYPEDRTWSIACGGTGLGADMGPGHNYAVYPDGMPDRDGARRISENVFVLSD